MTNQIDKVYILRAYNRIKPKINKIFIYNAKKNNKS